jgi:hypothetical protein
LRGGALSDEAISQFEETTSCFAVTLVKGDCFATPALAGGARESARNDSFSIGL